MTCQMSCIKYPLCYLSFLHFQAKYSQPSQVFTTLTKQNPNNCYASTIYTGNGQFYFILQVDLKKDGFLLGKE